MASVLVSRFDFPQAIDAGIEQMLVNLPAPRSPMFLLALLRELRRARGCDVMFLSNPGVEHLLLAFLARRLFGVRACVFDLILRAPANRWQRGLAALKSLLLAAVDRFLFIHRDTSGYREHFGIPEERCRYVAFKANNFDLAHAFEGKDDGYVLSLGASHRDYNLLIEAVRGQDLPVIIVLPKASIDRHNAAIDADTLPANVTHVSDPVDRISWNRYIAGCRLVAIPLLPDVIQPAGISVYLEAMALGKPVVITRGASTAGLLTDDLAELVPQADVAAMRGALLRLWNDAARRRALSAAGREYALGLGDHARLVRDLWNHVMELRSTAAARADR